MQKLYYSISDVSELIHEEQHILRYWEKEFHQLKPKKNRGGNRVYSQKDLTTIKLIKKLLRHDKLSLKGAKENLEKLLKENESNINIELNSDSSENLKNNRIVQSEIDNKLVFNRNVIDELINQFKELRQLIETV